jgi:hypothetical protein
MSTSFSPNLDRSIASVKRKLTMTKQNKTNEADKPQDLVAIKESSLRRHWRETVPAEKLFDLCLDKREEEESVFAALACSNDPQREN